MRLSFRSDRPYEIGLASFAAPGSKAMARCVLTATMGNYARLRRLHLGKRVILSTELWPRYDGDGFSPSRSFELGELRRTRDGHAIVAASPDEKDPASARYAPGTFFGWKYRGAVATQYWRSEHPPPALVVRVNGRAKYWASRAPIPGGISFENFELIAPFVSGQEFWFGVSPRTPAALGYVVRPKDRREPSP